VSSGGAYLVKEQRLGLSGGLKLAKDGLTILIPQPSEDLKDPLNWSELRKHTVLLAALFPALLTDLELIWQTTDSQAEAWHTTLSHMTRLGNWAILFQGLGSIIIVPFMQRYGR